MVIGIVLVVVGLMFFAQTLELVSAETMQVLWPLSLVVLGVVLLSHKALGHNCQGEKCWCGGAVDLGLGSSSKNKRKRS